MNRTKTTRLLLLSFFIAVEIVLCLTPLGYVPVGPLRATTLHIPVILAGMILGVKEGVLTGFIFGLTSLLINTFSPTPTSFIFSPFYSLGEFQGNFSSLMICFIPRILLGASAGYLVKKIPVYSVSITAALSTFLHTSLVSLMIYFFFASSYAAVKAIEVQQLFTVLLTLVATNGLLEMILAVGLCAPIVSAYQKVNKSK